MDPPKLQFSPHEPDSPGSGHPFDQELARLHQLTVWARWLMVGLVWVILGPVSLWGLRAEIVLWWQYFTWTAVRYGLAYHPIAAVGLGLCIGLTVATLVWQSRNILWGLPRQERLRLLQQMRRIRRQGPSHPLWKWVCGHSHPQ